jgi:hypothetical protein
MEMKERILVYCPERKEKVPISMCTGSFFKNVPMCKNLIRIVIDFRKHDVEVKCRGGKGA